VYGGVPPLARACASTLVPSGAAAATVTDGTNRESPVAGTRCTREVIVCSVFVLGSNTRLAMVTAYQGMIVSGRQRGAEQSPGRSGGAQ
jgi:hypothetical protein